MLERSVPVLRVVCLLLAGVVFVQLSWLALRKDPLAGIRVPAILKTAEQPAAPTKAPQTNAPMNRAQPPKPVTLPADVQMRVDRVVYSEVLAPLMRPPPMALLGIAGEYVFFRGPQGQTGLLREGEELGGVKLLKIGTNRILVEQNGKKEELTIFSGFGSETLLSPGKDHP